MLYEAGTILSFEGSPHLKWGRMSLMLYPEISKTLWNNELWSHSYYLETVGSVSEEAIKKYIEQQKK